MIIDGIEIGLNAENQQKILPQLEIIRLAVSGAVPTRQNACHVSKSFKTLLKKVLYTFKKKCSYLKMEWYATQHYYRCINYRGPED